MFQSQLLTVFVYDVDPAPRQLELMDILHTNVSLPIADSFWTNSFPVVRLVNNVR